MRWDTGSLGPGNEVASEASVEPWQDPNPDLASAKISLVDLTARGGKRPLEFHDPAPPAQAIPERSDLLDPSGRVSCSPSLQESDGPDQTGLADPAGRDDTTSVCHTSNSGSCSGLPASSMPRLGRRETCIINCAIAATAWPHIGGKRFHKPIVVDVDLPVWRE